MRVAALSTTPAPPAHHHHHHHHYHPYCYRKPSTVVLRTICRNQQEQHPEHDSRHAQHVPSTTSSSSSSSSLEHSKLISTTQRRIHNQRLMNARQRHYQLHQHVLYSSSSSSSSPSCSFEEERQPPSPTPPSPSTVPSLQSTPSSTPSSTPQRPQRRALRRRVQFEEQLSFLPTTPVLLTPELIDELWYSRRELDHCKVQVRNDFWACVKKCPSKNTTSSSTSQRTSSSSSSTTSSLQQQQQRLQQQGDEEMCWVGMERYWDAVNISSTQRGLKQAVLQAQHEQLQQQQPPFHLDDLMHLHVVLGSISQQWSRACQERAWWYASMVTEQVYGKGFDEERLQREAAMEQQLQLQHEQQQQQQRMIMEESYDYYNHQHDSANSAYEYYMETDHDSATTALYNSYASSSYNNNNNYNQAACYEQA